MTKLFSRMLFLSLAGLAAVPARAADEETKKEEAAKDLSIEEFLQSLSTVQGVVARRDPFGELGPPFEMPQQKIEQVEDPFAPTMGAPVLERFPITDYEVVAVLLGEGNPRALLRLPAEAGGPASRKVVIVKESDRLGNRKGVIAKIVLEGVVVQQALRSAHGFVDKTEVLLKVGGKTEDQRRSLVSRPVENK